MIVSFIIEFMIALGALHHAMHIGQFPSLDVRVPAHLGVAV
jgi:hypothetical protein